MSKLLKKYKDLAIEKNIDIEAIWDKELSLSENLKNVFGTEEITALKDKLEKSNLEAEQIQKNQFEIEEDKAKEELNKSIKEISNSTNNDIDRYFIYLNKYVDTLINSKSVFGLIVEGDAGLGKSFTTIKRLNDNKLDYEKDYILFNTHSSPMELYECLYRNIDKIIVLDDISNLFEDEIKVNILMSALWSPTKERVIHWHTSSEKLKSPSYFTFTGKIIVLTNKLPIHLDTLKSRCFHFELNFSYSEKLKLIYEIGKLEKMDNEVMKFIKDNSSEASNLNFRTLFKINEIYKANINNGWEKIANLELEVDEQRAIFLEVVKELQFKTVNEQVNEFTKRSGFSRRQYFRIKHQLMPKSINIRDTI